MTRNAAYLLESEAAPVMAARFPFAPFAAPVLAVALVALAIAMALACQCAPRALADDEPVSDAQLTALELQQKIEDAQATYASIREEMEGIQASIDEKRDAVADLEREIPEQQERSARAARELYKIQQDGIGLVDLLLSANSLDDFLTSFEYVNYLTDANVKEMDRLAALHDQINGEMEQLEQSYAEADSRAVEAQTTIEELQAAQAEVQRRIEEEARIAAEKAAQAEAARKNPRANDEASASGASQAQQAGDSQQSATAAEPTQEDASTETQPEPEPEAAPEPEPEPEPEPQVEPVAASDDEAAFMAEWTARIDAYLAGSPLAGQGATFARAAYTYGVDPRWSPAISFTESGKGAACFLPHNAWGWGSVSWDSWEEAINDHVAGLSRGYGYTISLEAAQKYCPPNAQGWYERTLGQMNLI